MTVVDGVVAAAPVRSGGPAGKTGETAAPAPVPYTPTEPAAPAAPAPAASGPPERDAADADGDAPGPVRDEPEPPAAPEPGTGASPDGGTDGAGSPGAETSRTPAHGTGAAGRSRRRVVLPAALLGAMVIGLLAREYAPAFGGDDKPSAGASSTPSGVRTPTAGPSASPSSSPTPSPTPSPREDTDLLTPAGARRVLNKMEALTGGTKVLPMFDLRPDRASGHAPLDKEIVPGKKVFDSFSYEEGQGTLQGSVRILKGHHLLDLDRVDWDALPRLLRIAHTELGVLKTNPDDTYVIFDWYDGQAAILIYANGEYGTGGMLISDFDGRIIRRVRAD